MKFMEWLRGKLFGARRDVFSEAVAATDEATHKTRSLRQQLEPYRLEDDPFISMTRKRLLAEAFSASEVAQIYQGPPR